MNGAAFLAYVEQALAPTLSRGDVVVLDNLSSHKVAGVREAVEARGASLLYLPPYSPDLNPVRGTAPDASLRQTQGPAQESRRAHHRGVVERHRPLPRPVRADRVRQLPRQLRLSTVSMKPL